MAKRSADNELTHDNWDQEQDEEEAGFFRIASKDVLEKREFKKAKRRVVADEKDGTGAFKGFSFGLSTNSQGSMGSRPISFAALPNNTSSESTTRPSFGGYSVASVATSTVTATTSSAVASVAAAVAKSCSPKSSSGESSTESQYHRNLRALNESVLRWIEEHVKATPCCILTPVFNDYEKYVRELGCEFPQSSSGVVGKTSAASTSAAESMISPASIGASSSVSMSSGSSAVSCAQTSSSAAVGAGLFTFGTTMAKSDMKSFAVPTSTTAVTTGFSASEFKFSAQDSKASAGLSSVAQPPTEAPVKPTSFSFSENPPKETPFKPTGFSFSDQPTSTSATGFVFSFQSAKAATSSNAPDDALLSVPNEGGDENYVPPKTEVVDIREDDAFYTVRCKLYFKIKDAFQDRGVGNLYLKPCGDKTQLLVRAGTNLGNILLNIMLTKSIPTNRQGNNVTMVCIPNPPIEKTLEEQKPVCMLIRVKKEDDAETLLKQINDHKV